MESIELDALRTELAQLRGTLADLERRLPQPTDEVVVASPDAPVSRRSALRTAGIVAAGALASGAVLTRATERADAATMVQQIEAIASPYESAVRATTDSVMPAIRAEVLSLAEGTNAIEAALNDGSHLPNPLVAAVNASAVNCSGVYAFSARGYGIFGISGDGTGVSGVSSTGSGVMGECTDGYAAGVRGISTLGAGLRSETETGTGLFIRTQRAAVTIAPYGDVPFYRAEFFSRGEIVVDGNANLWYCVQDGTSAPSSWRKLAGPSSAGTFHAISPARVYDSRSTAYALNGPIVDSAHRTVDVANKRNSSGVVVAYDIVPYGARAVAANVTVTRTIDKNYLCINPGGDTTRPASTINWFASGQTLANGVVLTLNADRELTIVAGDQGGSAHVIIDVTGYWI